METANKGLCKNYPEGEGGMAVGKLERGIEENDNKRGGLDIKFNTYRGALPDYFFIPLCKLEK